jgi:hypothetical protein
VIFVFGAPVTPAPKLFQRPQLLKKMMVGDIGECRDSRTPSLEQVASTARGGASRYVGNENVGEVINLLFSAKRIVLPVRSAQSVGFNVNGLISKSAMRGLPYK